MKIVCKNCERRMVQVSTGAVSIEYTTAQHDIPYRIWRSDVYSCLGCKAIVLAGFAVQPTERRDPAFASMLQTFEKDATKFH